MTITVADIDSTRVDEITTTTSTTRVVPGSLTIAAGLGWRVPGAVLEFLAADNERRHLIAASDIVDWSGLLVAPNHAKPAPLGPLDFEVPGGRITMANPTTVPAGRVLPSVSPA